MGSPSDDTTTASFTPGTRSAKFCTSQLRFLASELSSMVVFLSSGWRSAVAGRDRWVVGCGPAIRTRAYRYWIHRLHHGLC